MLVEPMGIEPLTASTDFPRIFRFVTLPPSIVWVVVVASGHNLATSNLGPLEKLSTTLFTKIQMRLLFANAPDCSCNLPYRTLLSRNAKP